VSGIISKLQPTFKEGERNPATRDFMIKRDLDYLFDAAQQLGREASAVSVESIPVINNSGFSFGVGMVIGRNSSGDLTKSVAGIPGSTYVPPVYIPQTSCPPGKQFFPNLGQMAYVRLTGSATQGQVLFLSTTAGTVEHALPSDGVSITAVGVYERSTTTAGIVIMRPLVDVISKVVTA